MDAVQARKGLPGSALKWIAICSMLLDQVGATLVFSWYLSVGGLGVARLYGLLRTAGRIAFPIFCFLLVEGFFHTQDRKKYALRLSIFSLAAEIPFDLAVQGTPFSLEGQNVFFTLLLGFLAMWGSWELIRKQNCHPGLAIAVLFPPCGFAAEALGTDYGFFGVLLIGTLFAVRGFRPEEDENVRVLQLLLGAAVIVLYCWHHGVQRQLWAVLGLVLTLFYNGQRGKGPKWFFYWFYPVHLAVLGVLNMVLF